jgi:flagella basal body P-ring formation protein FlgA
VSGLLLAALLVAADPLAPLADEPSAKVERLVRRGEPVTLRLQSGSLTIATAGRALADGQRGARVRVVALATRRTLEGIVEGPGEIRLLTP